MKIITNDLDVEVKNPAIESAILNLLSGRFTKSNLVATHQSVWGISQRKKILKVTTLDRIKRRDGWPERKEQKRRKYAQASWATRKERIKKGLKLLPGPKTKCGPRLLEIHRRLASHSPPSKSPDAAAGSTTPPSLPA